MQAHSVSTPLPPKLQGGSLGSITIRFKRLQINDAYEDSSTFCRLQFWGEDQFIDIDSDELDAKGSTSIEYPLIGSMHGIKRYFSDMGVLPIPIIQKMKGTKDEVLLGQGNVPLLQVLNQLIQLLKYHKDTRSKFGSNGLSIPLISLIPSAKELDPFQCHQFGEMELEFVLTIHCHEISEDKNSTGVSSSIDVNHVHSVEVASGDSHRPAPENRCLAVPPIEIMSTFQRNVLSESVTSISCVTELALLNKRYTNRSSTLRDSALREFHLDDESLSLATEDDSVLLDAILGDRSLLRSSQPTSSGRNVVRRVQARNYRGSNVTSVLLRDESPKRRIKLYPSIMFEGKEHSHDVAKVRFASLDIKSLTLSSSLFQPVANLIRKGRYRIHCWLKFKAPPLALIPLNQSNTIIVSVCSKIVENYKVATTYNTHQGRQNNRRSTQQTKVEQAVSKFEGPHEVAHSTLWNLQFSHDSHVRSWMHASLNFELIATIHCLDKNYGPSTRLQREKGTLKAIPSRANDTSRQDVLLATAQMNLGDALSSGLSVETSLPLRSATKAASDSMIVKLCLLPPQNDPITLHNVERGGRSCSHEEVDNASSSDLMEDTIISEASRSRLPPRISISPAQAFGARVSQTKHIATVGMQQRECDDSRHIPKESRLSSIPLWMYLSISDMHNLTMLPESIQSMKGAPPTKLAPTYTHIRIKASASGPLIGLKSPTSEVTFSCHDGSKNKVGYKGVDFTWITMLKTGEWTRDDYGTITVELWTCMDPYNNKPKMNSDVQLGTVAIPFRIPAQISPNIAEPVVVIQEIMEVRGKRLNKRGTVNAVVAVGLLRQVRYFASLSQSARDIQRWWRINVCHSSGNCYHGSTSASTIVNGRAKHLSCVHLSQSALLIQKTWRKTRQAIKNYKEETWIADKLSLLPTKEMNRRNADESGFKKAENTPLSDEPLSPCQIMNNQDGHAPDCKILKAIEKVLYHRDRRTIGDRTENRRTCMGKDLSAMEHMPCIRSNSDASRYTHNIEMNNIGDNKEGGSSRPHASAYAIIIRFGECSGVREIIALWADNDLPFCNQQDFVSSGILITFSMLARSSLSSKPEHLFFSSGITRMGSMNRHLASLNYEFSVLIDESDEVVSYVQSEMLVCKLWFVPMVTEVMSKHYPTSSTDQVTVPKLAKVVCSTRCPLTVLANNPDVASYLCPWSLVLASDSEDVIGQVQITIGSKANTWKSTPAIKLNSIQRNATQINYSDIFDWDLPDKIEAAISQPKQKSNSKGREGNPCSIEANHRPYSSASRSYHGEEDIRSHDCTEHNRYRKSEERHEILSCEASHGAITTLGNSSTNDCERKADSPAPSLDDSWSERNLASVLASLDVATSALASKAKNEHTGSCQELPRHNKNDCNHGPDASSEIKSISQVMGSLQPMREVCPPLAVSPTKLEQKDESMVEPSSESKCCAESKSAVEAAQSKYGIPTETTHQQFLFGESKHSTPFQEHEEAKDTQQNDSDSDSSSNEDVPAFTSLKTNVELYEVNEEGDTSDDSSTLNMHLTRRRRSTTSTSSSSSSSNMDATHAGQGDRKIEAASFRRGKQSSQSSSDSSSMYRRGRSNDLTLINYFHNKPFRQEKAARILYLHGDSDYSSDSSTSS